jgi:hypothetical protein
MGHYQHQNDITIEAMKIIETWQREYSVKKFNPPGKWQLQQEQDRRYESNGLGSTKHYFIPAEFVMDGRRFKEKGERSGSENQNDEP